MLQGRLFSYSDTQRYRLGVNYQQIPVNCPYATRVSTYQRDGSNTLTQNNQPNYFPNSFSGSKPDLTMKWSIESIDGDLLSYETNN